MNHVRTASVQCGVDFGNPESNADRIVVHLRELATKGVVLAVFPEAALTGYCVGSIEEARRIALSVDPCASWRTRIQGAVDELGMVAIAGAATSDGSRIHNTALLFEAGQPLRTYRKTHLPMLGLDRFVEPGVELPVFDTRAGKIGILVCFDLRPPEAARVLSLKGAEILAVPTNWPEGALVAADVLSVARAAENRVFVVSSNRVGSENGFRFIGRSKIIDPTGLVMAAAGDGEEVLVADLDLRIARSKRTVVRAGEYETETFASRRPELYGELVASDRFSFGTNIA